MAKTVHEHRHSHSSSTHSNSKLRQCPASPAPDNHRDLWDTLNPLFSASGHPSAYPCPFRYPIDLEDHIVSTFFSRLRRNHKDVNLGQRIVVVLVKDCAAECVGSLGYLCWRVPGQWESVPLLERGCSFLGLQEYLVWMFHFLELW